MTLGRYIPFPHALFLLAAAGCAAPYGEIVPPDPLEDWIGKSERALVLKWGAPDAVYDMKEGGRILTWRRSRTESQGGALYTVTETQVIDGKTVVVPLTREAPTITWRYHCTASFELDYDGYVVDYTAEGNDCGSSPLPEE